MSKNFWLFTLLAGFLLLSTGTVRSEDDEAATIEEDPIVEDDIGKAADASRTDAEVNRLMKLIINSLYKNKEIFLREIISNASDALDKIRLMGLTDSAALEATDEMSIKIKIDKENNVLHVSDTGIGITKADLIKNLGTIAKSGTSDFFEKMSSASSEESVSDLIGQFGVGFYSSFLVADKVVVTSKNNNDPDQHIWESDSESFSVVKDPRGVTLGRGTTVSLYMKEEALDYLEDKTVKDLISKYSQFMNFPIYLWGEKTITEEVPLDEEDQAEEAEVPESDDDEAAVEEEEEEDKPK